MHSEVYNSGEDRLTKSPILGLFQGYQTTRREEEIISFGC